MHGWVVWQLPPFLFSLQVKRPITLHEGHLDFFVDTWDSQGRKHTLPVRLLHQERHGDVDNTEVNRWKRLKEPSSARALRDLKKGSKRTNVFITLTTSAGCVWICGTSWSRFSYGTRPNTVVTSKKPWWNGGFFCRNLPWNAIRSTDKCNIMLLRPVWSAACSLKIVQSSSSPVAPPVRVLFSQLQVCRDTVGILFSAQGCFFPHRGSVGPLGSFSTHLLMERPRSQSVSSICRNCV